MPVYINKLIRPLFKYNLTAYIEGLKVFLSVHDQLLLTVWWFPICETLECVPRLGSFVLRVVSKL